MTYMPARLRHTIIVLVVVVWVLNFLAGMAIPEYERSEAINGIFMAIVGGALALGGDRKANDT